MKTRLVLASQKGGVGKSTISLNLAVAFAEMGYKTVVIDTDPQGALNLALAKGSIEFPGLAEAVIHNKAPSDLVKKTNLPNLSLMAKGQLALKNIPEYERVMYQGKALSSVCDDLEQDHDLIVIDTPAGLGMITRAVMRVGTHISVPFQVDMLNLRSVNQILEVIDHVQLEENPELEFIGLVLNMFEKEKDVSFEIAGEVWRDFPAVFDTTIPRADVFMRASKEGVPLAFLGRKKHPEARRFSQLASEMMDVISLEEAGDDIVRRLL